MYTVYTIMYKWKIKHKTKLSEIYFDIQSYIILSKWMKKTYHI